MTRAAATTTDRTAASWSDVTSVLRDVRLVDGHHHLWEIGRFPYRWLEAGAPPARFGNKREIARDYLPKDHLGSFAGLSLAGSVHVQANCGAVDPVEETRWIQDLSDHAEWAIAIVGEVDLTSGDARSVVERHRAFPALRGVRTPVAWDADGRWRVASRPGVLADPVFHQNAARLVQHDLCLEMVVVPEQLDELATFAAALPGLNIAVNHFGTLEPSRPGNADAWMHGIKGLSRLENVYMKLSGLWTVDKHWNPSILRPFVDQLIDQFGSDRVLYGSNAPVESVNCPVSCQFLQLASILSRRSRKEITDIFSLTASTLYRL